MIYIMIENLKIEIKFRCRKFRQSARVSVLYKKHSRCSAQSWVFTNGRAERSAFISGFDDENTILIHQISGLKTEASFFGFLFHILSKRENQIQETKENIAAEEV